MKPQQLTDPSGMRPSDRPDQLAAQVAEFNAVFVPFNAKKAFLSGQSFQTPNSRSDTTYYAEPLMGHPDYGTCGVTGRQLPPGDAPRFRVEGDTVTFTRYPHKETFLFTQLTFIQST